MTPESSTSTSTTTPAPSEPLPGSDRAYKILWPPIEFLVNRLWNVEVEGVENIPDDGPAIIAPNHLSFCDSVFIPASLPRRMWAIGKGEYMDSWKTKYLFSAFGMIPVDRSGGDAAQVALDAAARVLEAGNLFLMYPEGTRSRSGNLHKGRTGPARLALRCNAPIIPVGHEGTVEIQPPDTALMKPFKTCTIRFGAPMHLEDHGDADDPRTIRAFTDAVMFQISKLSGQRYVHTYASSSDKPDTTDAARVAAVLEPRPVITLPDTEMIPRPRKRALADVGAASEASNGADLAAMVPRPKRRAAAS